MGWILLEALVALVLAIAIVWWTTSARRKPRTPRAPEARKPDQDERQ